MLKPRPDMSVVYFLNEMTLFVLISEVKLVHVYPIVKLNSKLPGIGPADCSMHLAEAFFFDQYCLTR